MDKPVTTVIDKQRCIGCGVCVQVCPADTLSVVEGKSTVTGERTLHCGHCQAVCPTEAIKVEALDPDTLELATIRAPQRWMPFGKYNTPGLVALMRSRRSTRNYKPDPVPLDILQDLVKIGIAAPSGTNEQAWTWTILPTREAVMQVGKASLDFFSKLNRMAGKRWLRTGLKLAGKPELADYHANYAENVAEAIKEFEAGGRERLFHGATAAILIGSQGGTTPREDALLAAQNILLAAHSMGLGTCLVGFVVEAASNDKKIKLAAGMPVDEPLHAVIALGYPAEKYQRQVGRPTPVVRVTE